MEKFIVRENGIKEYRTTGGLITKKYPENKYDVVVGEKAVARIPDYLSNAKGVAEGIAEILNRERKLILPI